MPKYEIVSKYLDAEYTPPLPQPATEDSAGCDLTVAQETLVPSLLKSFFTAVALLGSAKKPCTLEETKILLEALNMKPILVPTGIKCQLDKGTYLQLSTRSSTPLNYGLIVANAPGVIDADYYNNPKNEGEIFAQLYNLSPVDIVLKPGDRIVQAIVQNYVPAGEPQSAKRSGGMGSTGV